MNNNILEVFYNVLLNEAANGKVDCYFKYNMRFNTKIFEDNVIIGSSDINSELLVPTLMIKNKEEFDRLLMEYVDIALRFYDEFDYCEEIRKMNYQDNELGISKEKLIMTLLWSNATVDDFNNPCDFLRKRINFFQLGNLEGYLEETNIGYSKSLGYDVNVEIVRNRLENETPYALNIYLISPTNGARVYEFPKVYFGIYNNSGYVYAIQNDKNRVINERYLKKINRLLYKVNSGLDVKGEVYENYGVGNLKDITPNSLLTANILMGLFKSISIDKIIIPSNLICRWNSKLMLMENKKNKLLQNNTNIEEINKFIKEYEDMILYIQSNLNEKFLRVFRRLVYHHSTMVISSYPYELNANLEISILDEVDVCNNTLLEETYKLGFVNRSNCRRKNT